MPIAPIKTISDVLPAEMKGSGRPVGGIDPEITAMFKIVCMAITAAMPAARSAPYRVLALRATLISKITKTR